MIKKTLLAMVISIFFSSIASGADYTGQTVCSVQMDVYGRAVLQPCGTWTSKGPSCGDGWVEWYENESAGGGKGMHAIALAALMGNKTVTLRIDDNNCSGQWDHLIAIRIVK